MAKKKQKIKEFSGGLIPRMRGGQPFKKAFRGASVETLGLIGINIPQKKRK